MFFINTLKRVFSKRVSECFYTYTIIPILHWSASVFIPGNQYMI